MDTQSHSQALRHLRGWLLVEKARLGMAMALMLLHSVMSIAPYYILWLAADSLIAGDTVPSTLLNLAAWLCGAIIAKFVLQSSALYLSHAAAFRILCDVRLQLIDQLNVLPYHQVSNYSSGEVRNILINDIEKIENFVAHNTVEIVAAIGAPVAAGAFLFWLDWRLALCALIPIPLGFLCQMYFYKGSDSRMTEYLDSVNQLNTTVVEYVRGIKAMKVYGQEGRSFAELERVIQRYHTLINGYIDLTVPSWSAFVVLLNSSSYFVLPLGAWLMWQGDISASTLLLFLLIGGNMLKPLLKLTMFASLFKELQFSLTRLGPLFGSPSIDDPSTRSIAKDSRGLTHTPVQIQMKGVYLERGGQSVLEDVDVSWDTPGLYGLVGQSGSGKSSLALLLAGQLEQTSGEVTINGEALGKLTDQERARLVMLVTQEPILFKSSIRQNLTLGRAGIDDAQLWQALAIVQLDEYVAALKDGLGSLITESGRTLSGGEQQRFALARGLVAATPVIILDEALAFADALTEARTYRAIQEHFPATILISIGHRMHAIQGSTRIDVCAHGRLVESGNHQQLLDAEGLFARLWSSQFLTQEWQLVAKKG